MNVDDLARRIVVRRREAGYLRLELPAELCYEAALAAIDTALRGVSGVYRVSAYGADRRLAVYYDAHATDAAQIARTLKVSLATLPPADMDAPATEATESVPLNVPQAVGAQLRQLGDLVRGKFGEFRSAASQGKLPGVMSARLQPVLASALTEKATTNFLNDVLAFYLIRVHWDLITRRWLVSPVKHADAWLTVFYMVFLLVRYRKSVFLSAPPATDAKDAAPATATTTSAP